MWFGCAGAVIALSEPRVCNAYVRLLFCCYYPFLLLLSSLFFAFAVLRLLWQLSLVIMARALQAMDVIVLNTSKVRLRGCFNYAGSGASASSPLCNGRKLDQRVKNTSPLATRAAAIMQALTSYVMPPPPPEQHFKPRSKRA